MAYGFDDPPLIFPIDACTVPSMTYTQQQIEILSRELESEYMDGTRTAAEAIGRVVKDLHDGDFCRRRLSLEDEVFSADDIMQAVMVWTKRIYEGAKS